MIVAVVGGSKANESTYRLAEEVGVELAKRRIILVCGGLTGVMEAACKGARSNGGMTIGILPGDNRKDANDYVDIAIPTGLGIARNALVVKAGNAVIALDGEYGTLSEVALALAERVPVISLGGEGHLHRMNIDNQTDYTVAVNPVDAVEKAIAAADNASKREFSHWREE